MEERQVKMFELFIQFAKRSRRLARRLLRRVPRIQSGPGKGLCFDGGPATGLFLYGEYERPVQEALLSLVCPGDVFYDIGANVGFFSVLAGKLVGPGGTVYAFEPVPENASMVERNARLNTFSNIKVLKVGLSDQTGKSELLLARYSGGAVLKSAGVPPDLSGSIVIETATIDDIVNLQEVRPPDIVKIDVEGAELKVLHGMVETLREWGPKVIMEFDDAVEGKCMEKLSECQKFLKNSHYQIEILPNSYRDGNWFVRHFIAQRETSVVAK